MNNRSKRRSILTLCALGLGVAFAGAACGGRAVTIDDGTGGTGANIGTGASAGVSSAGGSRAFAGAGGRASGGTGNVGVAGSPSAGASSAGAGNTCSFTPCPPIACGSNSTLVFPNGACCATCVSNCSQQPCPGIACASGYHPETQPDQCCPVCVADPLGCGEGEKKYLTWRAQLTDKYKYGCNSDSDCLQVAPTNQCEAGCSYVPIAKGNYASLTMNLSGEAAMDCANCPPMPQPPCAAPLPPSCSFGQCVSMTGGPPP